jgi:hypothetical protein
LHPNYPDLSIYLSIYLSIISSYRYIYIYIRKGIYDRAGDRSETPAETMIRLVIIRLFSCSRLYHEAHVCRSVRRSTCRSSRRRFIGPGQCTATIPPMKNYKAKNPPTPKFSCSSSHCSLMFQLTSCRLASTASTSTIYIFLHGPRPMIGA